MYKFAFLEDDDQDFNALKECINEFSKRNNEQFSLTRFTTGESFLSSYKPGDFDAVFFDIILGESKLNGLEASKQLFLIDPNVAILFITNMAQYAIQGYEVNAIDYIVKPLKYYDFSLKLKKLLQSFSASKDKKISFKSENDIVILNENEIYYVIVNAHYLSIYTKDREYILREPLKVFEKRLSSNFVRSGISFLINISKISKITSKDVYVNDKAIPITRSYKQEFLAKVNEYIISKAK